MALKDLQLPPLPHSRQDIWRLFNLKYAKTVVQAAEVSNVRGKLLANNTSSIKTHKPFDDAY